MRSFLPDMQASNAEKDSPSFGLQYAKFIESEWGSERITAQRAKIDLVNSHMEGTVDASHLKPLFKHADDASTLRVNWKYVSEVPRFINSIIEGFSYDKYRTSVKGVDNHSQTKRSQFRREKRKAMLIKEDAERVSQQMGMDFTPKGFIPESNHELDLWMELEYKQASEMAMELGIQKVLDFNDWRETFNHIAEDLAKHSVAAAHVSYDPDIALSYEYVNPRDFIYSRDVGNNRDHRGSYYFGQYMALSIPDIERMADGALTRDQLHQLYGKAGYTMASYNKLSFDDRHISVDVIKFAFKANRYEVFKKKYNSHGGYKYIAKDDYWEPHPNSKSQVLHNPYEVWYEGIYIPGTDIVLNYGVMDNMLRDPKNKRKAIPPFVMYQLSSESIGQKLVDICDDIYITQIKLRQVTLKLKPKGIAVDIDALGSLDMPDGSTLKPIEQVKIMMEDGNLLYSGSSLVDDTGNVRLPIHDLPDTTGQDMAQLMNLYNHHVNRLYQITGINPQAAGAAPPARTSSAVYEGTVGASMKVVNNIFNGLLSIQKRSAEAIISRLQSAAMFGETQQIVESILGEYTTDMLRELANVKYHQYIVNIDIRSTDEERAELIQSLGEALQTGSITLSDKIDIEEIDNLRLAKQVLKLRQKAMIERQERQAEMQHQRALQQSQAQVQAEMQKEQMRAEIENQKEMAKSEIQAMLDSREYEAKMRLMSLEKQYDLAIARAKATGDWDLKAYLEDRKDKRAGMEANYQSELAEQRSKNDRPRQFPERTTEDDSLLEGLEGQQPNL